MKKIIGIIVLLFSCLTLVAQNEKSGKLYKNIEDYKAGKAMEGYSVVSDSWKMAFGAEGVVLENNGKQVTTKLADLPTTLLTLDAGGMLMRVYKGKLYYVLAEGAMCFYSQRTEGRVSELSNGLYCGRSAPDASWPRDFYSDGIEGEIIKMKYSELERRLEEKGLKAQFEADVPKREPGDREDDSLSKYKNRLVKYIKLLNSK